MQFMFDLGLELVDRVHYVLGSEAGTGSSSICVQVSMIIDLLSL